MDINERVLMRFLIPNGQANLLRKALGLRQAQLDDVIIVGDALVVSEGSLSNRPVMKVWVGELELDKSLARAAPPLPSSGEENQGGSSV